MLEVFWLIGAIGLILIITGILKKRKGEEASLLLAGGICLEAYSLYIGDLIFIILQAAFIIAAAYEFIKFDILKK